MAAKEIKPGKTAKTKERRLELNEISLKDLGLMIIDHVQSDCDLYTEMDEEAQEGFTFWVKSKFGLRRVSRVFVEFSGELIDVEDPGREN